MFLMHSSYFFKLFPPPQFLLMPYAGIDISDDAISFIEYSRPVGERTIVKHGIYPLEAGIIEGGDIKNEDKLVSILLDIHNSYHLNYVKASIPEEKAYLFETDVPYADLRSISQSIEFKLEENVPLSAKDAVFSFDLLLAKQGKPMRASVSAVPQTYMDKIISIFKKAGITPISFETVPRAIAQIVSQSSDSDTIIIHSMKTKTGVYVVSDKAVGFTSTISVGSEDVNPDEYAEKLEAEISRVQTYWLSKEGDSGGEIKRVVIVGHEAERTTHILRAKVNDFLPIESTDIWKAVLDTTKYVPPILRSESFEYASAAGLAE